MNSINEKNWATYCHVAVFAGFIFPMGNIIAPLVIWLMKKDEYSFVDDQGKEVLNFQLTALIAFLISGLLLFVFIGFFLMLFVGVVVLIYTIKGIINTSEGKLYRYPFSIKFIQ